MIKSLLILSLTSLCLCACKPTQRTVVARPPQQQQQQEAATTANTAEATPQQPEQPSGQPPQAAPAESPEQALHYAADALARGGETDIGSALFAIAGACKTLGIDPEQALHTASEDFIRRFAAEEEGGPVQSTEIRQFLP